MLEVILATAKATGPLWATWSSESAQLIWFKHHQLRGAATSVHPVTEAWTVWLIWEEERVGATWWGHEGAEN